MIRPVLPDPASPSQLTPSSLASFRARGLIADGVYSVTEVACDGRGDDVDTVGDLETWN